METTKPTLATSDLPASVAVNADEGHTLSPTNELDRTKLEKQLSHRPERSELVEKNILKDSKVAPALQAAQAELLKAKLEDQLEAAILKRPERAELVGKNILKDSTVAPALQAAQAELRKAQLEDQLEHAIQKRPDPAELVKTGILHADEVPPA